MNGREFPKNSFEKFTAKRMLKNMKLSGGKTNTWEAKDAEIYNFAVKASDRNHNIWQRDPLAIRIFSREMAVQKLNYIHNNPLQAHWSLCLRQEDYRFSSASFYTGKKDEFNLLTHYMDVF